MIRTVVKENRGVLNGSNGTLNAIEGRKPRRRLSKRRHSSSKGASTATNSWLPNTSGSRQARDPTLDDKRTPSTTSGEAFLESGYSVAISTQTRHRDIPKQIRFPFFTKQSSHLTNSSSEERQIKRTSYKGNYSTSQKNQEPLQRRHSNPLITPTPSIVLNKEGSTSISQTAFQPSAKPRKLVKSRHSASRQSSEPTDYQKFLENARNSLAQTTHSNYLPAGKTKKASRDGWSLTKVSSQCSSKAKKRSASILHRSITGSIKSFVQNMQAVLPARAKSVSSQKANSIVTTSSGQINSTSFKRLERIGRSSVSDDLTIRSTSLDRDHASIEMDGRYPLGRPRNGERKTSRAMPISPALLRYNEAIRDGRY